MTMSEWSEKKLGDIAETTSGGTPDRKNQAFFGGSIPWVKSGELEDTFINDTEEKITPEGLKHSATKLFPSGTLLMAMYGATVGKTALLKIEAATNQAVCAIFPRAGEAGTEFLRYALVYQRPEILKLRYGGAQPNISQQVVRNLVVPLPPLSEQRKIAAVLGLVQQAIKQQERLIALTTELKKALLHKLFTEGLRGEPQKQTEIGSVPESWEVKRLQEVATIAMGQSPGGESYNSDGTGVPLINGPVEFGPGPLSETLEVKFTTQPTKFCERGDLILCVRGSTTGRTNIASGHACIGRGVAAIRASENQEYLNQFIISIRDRIFTMGTGTTFPNISGSQIKDILVPVPSIEMQVEIGRILSNLDRKYKLLQRKRAALTSLFRTLLHQLMTAQIRVNDLDLPELEIAQ
jgi:type I restriction enzyme S subunit